MQSEVMSPDILGERPISISQLRTFDRCARSYYLQYLTEPRTPVLGMGATVWFGKVIQQIIQRAYSGVPLMDGHSQVWRRECGPALQELQEWFDLNSEQQESGGPTSNARKRWNEDHRHYFHLAERIETFQREQLSEWAWSEKMPLTAYYRWSAHFAMTTPLSALLLPHATLVEGLPVRWPDGDLIQRFRDDGEDDGREHYQLLHGVIGGVHVVGVPDQFGVEEDGVAWISDNKVTTMQLSREELSEDAQLCAYYLFLKQTGWIAEGQPVRVGHCYIQQGKAPLQVWSDIAPYTERVVPQLQEAFAHLKSTITVGGPFRRVRGLQPSAFTPCKFCGVRYACL